MKKKSLNVVIIALLVLQSLILSAQQRQGPWKQFYDNGRVKATGQFDKGKPTGTFLYYYPGGDKQAEMVYHADGTIAHNNSYYEGGNLMASGKYVNRQKDSIWLYYGDSINQLISLETYILGTLQGPAITYYPGTDQEAEHIIYVDGIKEGPLRKYFPDGHIMTEGTYVKGMLEGPFTLYYPEGNLQLTGTYHMGKQTGDWKYYDEKGNVMDYEDFVRQHSDPLNVEDPETKYRSQQQF